MASPDDYLTPFERERNLKLLDNKRRMEELGLVRAAEAMRRSPPPARGRRVKVSGRPPTRSTGGVRTPAEQAYAASKVRSGAGTGGLPDILLQLCGTDETYTQRHIDALGTFQTEWDLYHEYVDSKRVYCKANGRTCHQCRQFTLGKRTSCNGCGLERHVMCGDCLWMRYGENLDETLANPSWLCPVCRDICNCSNGNCLRKSRGWPATGELWSLVQDRWPSAAHYLIITRQAGGGAAAAAVAPVAAAAAAAAAPLAPALEASEATDVSDSEAPVEPLVASPPKARTLSFRAAKATDAAAALRVGMVVRKRFSAGWFFGDVVSRDKKSGLWAVSYDDGDSEELTDAELRELAVSGSAMEAARDKAYAKLGKLAKRPRCT